MWTCTTAQNKNGDTNLRQNIGSHKCHRETVNVIHEKCPTVGSSIRALVGAPSLWYFLTAVQANILLPFTTVTGNRTEISDNPLSCGLHSCLRDTHEPRLYGTFKSQQRLSGTWHILGKHHKPMYNHKSF